MRQSTLILLVIAVVLMMIGFGFGTCAVIVGHYLHG